MFSKALPITEFDKFVSAHKRLSAEKSCELLAHPSIHGKLRLVPFASELVLGIHPPVDAVSGSTEVTPVVRTEELIS